MAHNGLVEVSEVGDGAARFQARLTKRAERLAEVPLVAAAVFEGLERYHDDRWGAGVQDAAETDIRWPDHGPLENTGALRASMTKPWAEGAVREITPVGFVYGTRLIYGKFLQGGTRKMARKPVLRVNRALRAVIAKLVRDFIAGEHI